MKVQNRPLTPPVVGPLSPRQLSPALAGKIDERLATIDRTLKTAKLSPEAYADLIAEQKDLRTVRGHWLGPDDKPVVVGPQARAFFENRKAELLHLMTVALLTPEASQAIEHEVGQLTALISASKAAEAKPLSPRQLSPALAGKIDERLADIDRTLKTARLTPDAYAALVGEQKDLQTVRGGWLDASDKPVVVGPQARAFFEARQAELERLLTVAKLSPEGLAAIEHELAQLGALIAASKTAGPQVPRQLVPALSAKVSERLDAIDRTLKTARLTPEGLAALQAEQADLKKVKSQGVTDAAGQATVVGPQARSFFEARHTEILKLEMVALLTPEAHAELQVEKAQLKVLIDASKKADFAGAPGKPKVDLQPAPVTVTAHPSRFDPNDPLSNG